ncbi:hydroxyisourate hydrolase [Flavobacterium paronense]|uniref:hydroxyisourate hydrolase n=1 Tax=Flavobacterium paronense TaxID=1392775 RepID=UPI0025B40FD6|nr:hydroxyisourate hydrolase [Flavobacterium paronense]MDN3675812.1 hydroxyisourate hydrolase [Flavobacterium paronense]
MLPDGDFSFLKVSQITTHVLDTSTGIPGKDISIRLQAFRNNIWQTIAQGITNGDGRIPDLLPQERNLKPDTYKMVFDTGNYYANTKTFYPKVESFSTLLMKRIITFLCWLILLDTVPIGEAEKDKRRIDKR